MGSTHPNSVRSERAAVHFIDNLNYLLDWPLTADDIARHLGFADAGGVERRLDRLGIFETPIAEAFRKRKPGYCPECRLVQYRHRQTCREFIPDRATDHRNRMAAAS